MAYVLTEKQSITLANGLTKEPVLRSRVGTGDSPVAVDIKVASGTGTAYLETSSDGFQTIIELKSAAISGAGTVSLQLVKETDAVDYPLRNAIRVSISTTSVVELENVRMCLEK